MKFIFKSLGKGFLYTIGRILAVIFIGFVIVTLITRFDKDSKISYPEVSLFEK